MRFRNFRLVHTDSSNGEADGRRPDEAAPDDSPLFDAYSRAVVDVVDAVGPAVVRVATITDRAVLYDKPGPG